MLPKESARLFAIPLFFLLTMGAALIIAYIKLLTGGEAIMHNVLEPVSLFRLLRAFSSGELFRQSAPGCYVKTRAFRQTHDTSGTKTGFMAHTDGIIADGFCIN